MKCAVIVYPGSNCDRDLAVALQKVGGTVSMVWHKETALPEGTDLVAVPGGFSYGDYLRPGAIAARAPVMEAVRKFATDGGPVLGICNGFQVLIEAGLLPGALMRNTGLKFICRDVPLEVTSADSIFTNLYERGSQITLPIAHHDGNFRADPQTLDQLAAEDRIAFRYRSDVNGSADRIAGILSQNRRVLGMMPHPERAIAPELGGSDGMVLFRGLLGAIVPA